MHSAMQQVDPEAPRGVDMVLLLVVVLALVAWFYLGHAMAWTTIAQSVALGLAFVGVAGIAAGGLLVAGVPRRFGRTAVAALTLLGVITVSSMLSGRGWTAVMGEPENGLGVLGLWVLAGVALAASIGASNQRELLRRVAPWVVAGESALFIAQIMGIAGGTSGTLPNSTYYGIVMVLLLPWVLGGLRDLDRPTLARAAVALIAIGTVAASGSRTALVVLVAWSLWVVMARSRMSLRLRATTMATVVAASAIAALAFARDEIIGSLSAQTLGLRPEMWIAGTQAVSMRPLLGWGADGFSAGAAAGSMPDLASSGALVIQQGGADPHSVILWIAVSGGLLAVAASVWLTVEQARVWWMARGDTDLAPGLWAVIGTLVILMTAPLPVQVAPLFALVWGAAQPQGDRRPADRRGLMGAGAVATLGVLLVVASLARAPFEVASPETSSVTYRAAHRASAALPFDSHLALISGRQWALSGAPDASTRHLEAMRRAVATDARDPYAPLELAVALRYYDAPREEVVAAFEEALVRYPFHPFARAEYATYLAEQGDTVGASRQLAIAERADLSQVPALQATLDEARTTIETAR